MRCLWLRDRPGCGPRPDPDRGRAAPHLPRLRLRGRGDLPGRHDRPAQGRGQGGRGGGAPRLRGDARHARDHAAPLGDVRRAVAGQRPAAPRLGRRDGRGAQRERRQQRRAPPPVPGRGDDGPLGQRRRELRPCRGAVRPAGPRARRRDPSRLRRPGGRLRVRDRARGRRPAVCLQEAVRPRRRDRRGLHLRLVRSALHPAADAARDPAARRGDRDALGRPGRGSLGGGRQPGRPPGRARHRVDGRGDEGRLRALHGEGDPRAAAGRPRAPAPAGRERGRGAARGADAERPASLPRRLWHELPRRLGRLRVPRPARRAGCDPRAGAAVHRPVRAGGGPRGRRHLRQPVGRDQGRAQRPRGGPGPGDGLLRPGQRGRLHPDPRRPAVPAAGLWLRDQRAGHQDVHQPGPDVPLPRLPPGGAGHEPPGAGAGPHGGDAGGRGRPGRGDRRPRSTPGTTCTAWATARPTRSPSRAPSSSRRSPTRTARGCSRPSSSTARCPR